MYSKSGNWGNGSGISKKELAPMKAWATGGGGGGGGGGGDDEGDGGGEGMPSELLAAHAEARRAMDALFKPLEAMAEGFRFADMVERFER